MHFACEPAALHHGGLRDGHDAYFEHNVSLSFDYSLVCTYDAIRPGLVELTLSPSCVANDWRPGERFHVFLGHSYHVFSWRVGRLYGGVSNGRPLIRPSGIVTKPTESSWNEPSRYTGQAKVESQFRVLRVECDASLSKTSNTFCLMDDLHQPLFAAVE